MLATIFVGLAGFYTVSNAIARDIQTRCGLVLAATTMTSSEYLVAKFCGNVLFLTTFIAGFMLTSMAMLVVRSETTLEPWVFVTQYLLLVPPGIVFAAVLAVVFESVPALSGRVGDVVYFVVWLGSLSVAVTMLAAGSDPGWARLFDYGGIGFVFEQVVPLLTSPNLSIGGSFDATKPLFVFEGLHADRLRMLPRLGALFTPLPLLAIALYAFHRFDPARVQSGRARSRRSWLAAINNACRPLLRVLPAAGRATTSRSSLWSAALVDARLTLTMVPLALLAAAGIAVATAANAANDVMRGVLPAAFAMAGLIVADVSCREFRVDTLGLIHAVPLLKSRFVWWKLTSAGIVAGVFLALPLVRSAVTVPSSLPALVTGVFVMTALAVSLGVISGTPKTFVVVFLSYMYVVTNDGGRSPALDFAGFYRQATPLITALYGTVGGVMLCLAQIAYARRLSRR
jgi:hypothetical protein